MRPAPGPGPGLKAPPYASLRERLLRALASVGAEKEGNDTRELREAIEEWWRAQQAWNEQLSELFGVHHEINNALVGIRGNAQLIQRSPVSQQPGIRERLEVVIRESQRIQEAALRLRDAKVALSGPDTDSRAA